MSRLKRLIHEIHRRSLWQVLGIYLGGAWVTLQGIEALVSVLGLPGWVPGFALVALIVGLPIVLATAFVQEGVGAVEASDEAAGSAEAERAATPAHPGGLHLVLTWRNVILGGVVVIGAAGIALAVALYVNPWTRAQSDPPITAIAVLPFDDMSPAGDQKWLGEGLAEDLIDSLSRIEELRVIARTSAFAHRGEDIAKIGESFQVGTVVEGSVRRSGDQLRVTAQLIRVADSSHLWSGSYDRQLSDVFAIQGEIARAIAEAIRAELGVQGTRSWLVRSRYSTPDVRAWELVKKAVDREGTLTEEGFRDEIDLTLHALAIDPEYAQAHAQHGWGYYYLWMFGHDPHQENLSRARTSAENALEHDPTNGAAHNLLGNLSARDGDWAGAEARYVRALEATPNHGPLRDGYGWVLLASGRVEEATAQFRRAIALDPEYSFNHQALGFARLAKGDYEAAIEEFQRAGPLGRTHLPYAHRLNGDDERAAEIMVELAPSPEVGAAWRRAFEEGGYAEMVRAALERQISQSGRPCTNNPDFAAGMLAIIGEPDRMFECMNEGIELKRPSVLAKVWPGWAPYRDAPRFTALLRRMGLEE